MVQRKIISILLIMGISFIIVGIFILKVDLDDYETVKDLRRDLHEEVGDIGPDDLGDNDTPAISDQSYTIEEKVNLKASSLEFRFTNQSLSKEVIDRITGLSYKVNNVITLEELSYIQVLYWGFDEKPHIGELIVNKKIAAEVVEIFKELYEGNFPIEKISLIDEYDADDDLSMENNNTSAFCFREVTGKKGVLSKHSYGIAIDINPIQNPYVKNEYISPSEGKDYTDRSIMRKGMIIEGDVCYEAFKNRGWIWGGEWESLKDYQHFEKDVDVLNE